MSRIRSRRKRKLIANKGSIKKGFLYGLGITASHLGKNGLSIDIGKLTLGQKQILRSALKNGRTKK
jgi:hypothetical protein